MKALLAPVLAAAVLAAGAGAARAEIELESSSWQSGRVEKPARPPKYADAAKLEAFARPPRLRGKAVLKNRGPKAAEGVLLRYTVAARLVPDRNAPAEAAWALPFLVDERRVPKVGPNQIQEVPLSVSPALENYLKRLTRQKFRANALKLSVMLEPGTGGGVKIAESLLEVGP